MTFDNATDHACKQVFAYDQAGKQAFTYKALRRAWKSLPRHGEPYYGKWVQMFFARVTFLRIMWNLRKKDRAKYLKIRRADWAWTMTLFRPYRKTWRKHMAGYAYAHAQEDEDE